MNTEVKVSPYVVRFAVAYAVALVGVGVILTVFDVEGGSSGSIAALFVGVVIAATKFVKEEKRVPNPSERKKLAWLSLVASFAVSLILAVGVLVALGQLDVIAALPKMIGQVGSGLVIGALVFATVLYSFALWFSYGWFAKIQFNSMDRKGEI
jgi:hypothetical protein